MKHVVWVPSPAVKQILEYFGWIQVAGEYNGKRVPHFTDPETKKDYLPDEAMVELAGRLWTSRSGKAVNV